MKDKLTASAYIKNYLKGFGLDRIIESSTFLTPIQKECLIRVCFNLEHPAMVGESVGLTSERVRQIYIRAQLLVRLRLERMQGFIDSQEKEMQQKKLLEYKIKVLTQKLNEQGKRPPTIEETDAIAIEDLDISVRAYNGLKANKVNTVGDIRMIDPDDFLLRRNIGKKTIEEIRLILDQMSIKW